MAAVVSVHQEMHERAEEKQGVGKHAQDVRPMLLPQEKCRNGREYAEAQRPRNAKSILHLNFSLLSQREDLVGREGRISRPPRRVIRRPQWPRLTGWRLPSPFPRARLPGNDRTALH